LVSAVPLDHCKNERERGLAYLGMKHLLRRQKPSDENRRRLLVDL